MPRHQETAAETQEATEERPDRRAVGCPWPPWRQTLALVGVCVNRIGTVCSSNRLRNARLIAWLKDSILAMCSQVTRLSSTTDVFSRRSHASKAAYDKKQPLEQINEQDR